MIETQKVQLRPSNKQLTKLFQYADAHVLLINWTISRERENYKQGNKFYRMVNYEKEFTQSWRKQDDYS